MLEKNITKNIPHNIHYERYCMFCQWWPLLDSNQRPLECESSALATEPRGHIVKEFLLIAETIDWAKLAQILRAKQGF